MTDLEFKAGDKVKCYFYGDEVFTLEMFGHNIGFSLKQVPLIFLDDGRYYESHTHPVLTLVERPKVKVQVTRWANIYPDGVADLSYKTESEAKRNAQSIAIACVELNGVYEI